MKANHQSLNLMGRIKQFICRPRVVLTALTAMFVVAVLPLGSANAWGPQRNTFTMQNPSTYVTFNSITDDTSWSTSGDERLFTVIKDLGASPVNSGATAKSSGFSDTAAAVSGHTYMVKMFVHNNASANLNLVANNTRVLASVPSAAGNGTMIQGQIKADNCGANTTGATGSPCLFWDEAYLTGSNFKVSYVANSARFYNNVKNFDTAGYTLSDNIVSSDGTGALLGYNALDGKIQGCFEYSGYVTFLVTVQTEQPSFTLEKKVRLASSTNSADYKTSMTAQPGDTLQYQIHFDNTGNTTQNQVVVLDVLPQDVNAITGTSYLYNAAYQDGLNKTDDSWFSIDKGWNIGNYTAGSDAYIEFQAKVPTADKLVCGDNLLQNLAYAVTPSGNQIVAADVTVHKDCATPCPTNPDLAIDDENCKPCPTNPNLNIDDPGCKPCPTNPDILANDPKCKPCKWNDKISADDAKCVGPGDAGFSLPPSATISLVLFLGLMGILLGGMFLRKKKSTRR